MPVSGDYWIANGTGLLCVAATSLTFLCAGISKVLRPKPFIKALRGYGLLPRYFVPFTAIGIPLTEVSLGMAIIRRPHSTVVAALCAALLLIFAAAMSATLVQGRRNVSCGCGLSGKGKISWLLVSRNVALAAVAFGGTPHGLLIAGMGATLGLLGAVFSARLETSPPIRASQPVG